MKVVFYIAASINGCIAASDGSTNWSAEDNAGYLDVCHRTGAVVIGRKTYEEYLSLPDEEWPCPAGHTVILTSNKSLKPAKPYAISFAPNPSEAMLVFRGLGKNELVVAGGNQTWTSFMKANLVDEIFIDVEPVAIGNGINLFSGADFERRLELMGTQALSTQTLQLHYRVNK